MPECVKARNAGIIIMQTLHIQLRYKTTELLVSQANSGPRWPRIKRYLIR